MSFSTTLYNTIFRRNSVFVGAIIGTAFFYDMAFHTTVDKYFDRVNQGKQWKDIKHRYVQSDEDEDDE